MPKQLVINRNETIEGPSPAIRKVLGSFDPARAARYIEKYYGSLLIPLLAKKFRVREERIIITYGEEDFFRTLIEGLPRSAAILTSEWHYSYFDKYLKFKGIDLRLFKMKERARSFAFDIEDCIRQARKTRPEVLIIASPNNPTGNSLSVPELKRIADSIPKRTLILIDEAYRGFNPEYKEAGFLKLLDKYPNLVLLRSFSKLYALAGLRVGYALCGKSVKRMLRYQNRYLGMSRILEEIASAALNSDGYYKKLGNKIIREREWFIEQVNATRSFKAYDSDANFVLVRFGPKARPFLRREMEREKALIWKFAGPGAIRVSLNCGNYVKQFAGFLRATDRKIK